MVEQSPALFVPKKPSEEVRRFLAESSHHSWKNALQFLLENFPMVKDGIVQWCVDGGCAVHLLGHERVPRDVDIVTRSASMAGEFANAGSFDVKTTGLWCRCHGLLYSPALEKEIFVQVMSVPFDERDVFVLNPVALTATKRLPYNHRPPRTKDIKDIHLLNAPTDQVNVLMQRWLSLSEISGKG